MKTKPQVTATALEPDGGVLEEMPTVALYGREDSEGLAGAPNLTNSLAFSPWSG
jgi:hypothetical protein